VVTSCPYPNAKSALLKAPQGALTDLRIISELPTKTVTQYASPRRNFSFLQNRMEGDVLTDKPPIIKAIRNPDLFGSLFKTQGTWVAWIGD
jgi:hypothetical protein